MTIGKHEYLGFYLFGYYKGMQISNVPFFSENTKKNKNGVSIPLTGFFEMRVYVINECEIAGVINAQASYQSVKEEKEESFLLLKSAIKIVENKLSGFNRKGIEQIRVNYKMYYQYSDKEIEESTRKKIAESAKSGRKIKLVPVYSFLLSNGRGENATDKMDCNMYNYVDVNMLTGEVTTDLDEEF